jgi:predicted transcriptional regulator
MHKKVKITLRLDAELARKVRALAEAGKKSASSLLAAHLRQIVHERKVCDRARQRGLARLREGLDLQWAPSSRNDLHER